MFSSGSTAIDGRRRRLYMRDLDVMVRNVEGERAHRVFEVL